LEFYSGLFDFTLGFNSKPCDFTPTETPALGFSLEFGILLKTLGFYSKPWDFTANKGMLLQTKGFCSNPGILPPILGFYSHPGILLLNPA